MARGLHPEGDRQPGVRLVRGVSPARRRASPLPLRPADVRDRARAGRRTLLRHLHASRRRRRLPLAGEHRARRVQRARGVVLDLAAAHAAALLFRLRWRRARPRRRPRPRACAAPPGGGWTRVGAGSPLRRVTRARVLVGALGAASLLGYGLGFPRLVSASPWTHVAYIGVFGGLFLLYVLAVAMVLRWRPDDRVLLGLVLAFALLFRLSLLGSPVVLSSDVYRYLWDGRVQWAGISPYRYPPTADELAPLRDEAVYPNINRPTKVTVYPPGAQAVFALMARVAPNSIVAWRVFLIGCEVAATALLLVLLRRAGVTRAAAIVYAWSPLVVFEGVQAGHVDLVVIPLMLAALAWRGGGSSMRAGIALGGAVLMKLYPLVLLPAWWRSRYR